MYALANRILQSSSEEKNHSTMIVEHTPP